MHFTEKWLPVPGHENDYMVSDHGRIWSHARGRVLRPTKRARGGHLVVTLKGRQWRVHRVVMLAFIGPPPEGMEVCHQDGDPENNHLSNLRYDTHAANVNDRRRHGTHLRGVDIGIATRFTEDDVRIIRVLHSEGLSYQKIADMYGIRDRHHIKKIVKRKIWAWVDDDKLTWQSRAHTVPTNAHKPD
ncbi:NUMOD4 motif-containing HNH endonuclease [Brevibacterium paucivorans]|uniref:NUMOD4 motif-containing HNH endonuclease n=1 Tax=Brevibacterium paucivorans TaxID=170994 RepID=UPI003D2E075F